MPNDQPSFIDRQRKANPVQINLKEKVLRVLLTKLGVIISGATSAGLTALIAWLAFRFGIDMDNPELNAGVLLLVNQLIWGTIQWAAVRYELPWKKELQRVLGELKEDGIINVATIKRAEIVKEFAESNQVLPATRGDARSDE